ncbi:MAG TPA: DUF2252 domain-containing protein [Gaiellaceae bacterium]|nr:DUF2252 domain-containing protein [Gaiellaceae bacterium]
MDAVEPVHHPTVAERVERGRAARATVPRSVHAQAELHPVHDPVAILEEQGKTRVQELLPIRYGRMVASPFAFYRGAAAVMANELSASSDTGLGAGLVGDAHLANFGGYASPERNLVFDINDFDETGRGPFEWDLKRLAASVEIAARAIGATDAERRSTVLAVARSYREAMRSFAAMGNVDVWYARADVDAIAVALRSSERRDVQREAERARTNGTAHDLAALTHVVDGEIRFVSKPPLVVPVEDLLEGHPDRVEHLRDIFRSYRRSLAPDRRRLVESFRYAHLARKVVGVGSVGMRTWVLLLLGRDDTDALILQIKEAGPSVLEAYTGRTNESNNGQRVVVGQRMAQAASDIFLGWTRVQDEDGAGRDYYVRQLRDWKMSVDVERLRPRGLVTYGGWCAWSLARAHARSGDRVAISAYLGKGDVFDRAIADFSAAYADVNERHHAALRKAIDEGRVTAVEGV